MARVANSNSTTYGAVDQGARTQAVSLSMYVSSDEGVDDREDMFTYWGYSSNPSTNQNFQGSKEATPPRTLWGGRSISPTADTTWYWKTEGKFYTDFTLNATATNGGAVVRKTWAVDPTVGTPTLSGETSSTVTVNFSWTPATSETQVDAIVQYKKTSDSTWTDWTSASDADQTGYTSRSSPGDFAATTITGLDADTSYDFRIKVDRSSTANTTKLYYGSTATTSTIADTPSVTTDAATGVTSSTATMNATVDHNTVDGNLSWRYMTPPPISDPDDTSGTEVSYASNPVTADGSYSKTITGLSASQQYHMWSIYEDASTADKYYGTIQSFTTAASPGALAAAEEHTVYIEDYAKYNVAKTVLFPLYSVGGASADRFVANPSPFGSAAYWISKDGATPVAVSAPNATQISSGKGLYSIDLSATEMSANTVDVIITDGGTNFRDVHIHITVNRDLGQVDINSSQNSNVSALILTGQGTGHGIEAVKGATGRDIDGTANEMFVEEGTIASSADSTHVTLPAASSTSNDYYNGSVILFTGGAGAGQARVITDYVGATKAAALNKALGNYASDPVDNTTTYIIFGGNQMMGTAVGDTICGISPGAELANLPYYSDYYAEMLQHIFQRVTYKRTETAAVHKMYKVDDAEVFAQYGVEDDGDTETKEKSEDV